MAVACVAGAAEATAVCVLTSVLSEAFGYRHLSAAPSAGRKQTLEWVTVVGTQLFEAYASLLG